MHDESDEVDPGGGVDEVERRGVERCSGGGSGSSTHPIHHTGHLG